MLCHWRDAPVRMVVVVAFLAACKGFRSFENTLQCGTAAQTWRPGHRRGGKYLFTTGRLSGGEKFVVERNLFGKRCLLYP